MKCGGKHQRGPFRSQSLSRQVQLREYAEMKNRSLEAYIISVSLLCCVEYGRSFAAIRKPEEQKINLLLFFAAWFFFSSPCQFCIVLQVQMLPLESSEREGGTNTSLLCSVSVFVCCCRTIFSPSFKWKFITCCTAYAYTFSLGSWGWGYAANTIQQRVSRAQHFSAVGNATCDAIN